MRRFYGQCVVALSSGMERLMGFAIWIDLARLLSVLTIGVWLAWMSSWMRISSDPSRSLGDSHSLGYVDSKSPTMLTGLNGVHFREIRVANEKVITQEDGSGR